MNQILESKQNKRKEKIDYWLKEGKKYIHPQKFLEWKKACEYELDGEYKDYLGETNGLEYDIAIEVFKSISLGKSYEEIKKQIDEHNLNELVYDSLIDLILCYASDGPNLYCYLIKNKANIDTKYVNKLIMVNQLLEQNYSYDEAIKLVKTHQVKKITFLNNEGVILVNKNQVFEGYIGFNVIVGKFYEDKIFICYVDNKNKEFATLYGYLENDKYLGIKKVYSITERKQVDEENIEMKIIDDNCTFTNEFLYENMLQVHKDSFNKKSKLLFENLLSALETNCDLPSFNWEDLIKSNKR